MDVCDSAQPRDTGQQSQRCVRPVTVDGDDQYLLWDIHEPLAMFRVTVISREYMKGESVGASDYSKPLVLGAVLELLRMSLKSKVVFCP